MALITIHHVYLNQRLLYHVDEICGVTGYVGSRGGKLCDGFRLWKKLVTSKPEEGWFGQPKYCFQIQYKTLNQPCCCSSLWTSHRL